MIELKDFPLPPSHNKLYANKFNGGRGRFKTTIYKQYEAQCEAWRLRNYHKLLKAKAELETMFVGQAIRIDHVFYFKRERIICKNGDVKRNDAWNYQKALHDLLAKILGIDDKLFWNGSIDKKCRDVEGVDLKLEFILVD